MIEVSRLIDLSGICLILFAVIGVWDGIYFHWYKYQLHRRAESRLEHSIHTLRAFLLAPIVYLIFAVNSVGWLLWIAVALVVIDFVAECVDLLVEGDSRKNVGGISSAEAMVHVMATAFRLMGMILILSAKPSEAWAFNAEIAAAAYPVWLKVGAEAFSFLCLVGGISQCWSSRAGLIHLPSVRFFCVTASSRQ